MRLSLLTWNSTNIHDGSPFHSHIPPEQLSNIQLNPVLTPRANDYPALSAAVKQGSILIIHVVIAGSQNINTNREILKKYFFSDNLSHNLVAQDEADSNRQYYRSGIPVGFSQENVNTPNAFYVRIQTDYPYWQLVIPTSDSWDVTGTADTQSITNIGNQFSKPIFTITPTTTKTAGLRYRRYIPIYNNIDKNCSLPLDITNGGLDTASLVTGTKMQASGNDLRVWMDNTEIDRWLQGMNSSVTKIFSNITLGPRIESTLLAGINNSVTTITFPQTKATVTFLQSLSKTTNQTLLLESESITFDPDNIDFLNFQITSVIRGQKGTTAASHSASITVRYIEHDLFLMYGDSDLGTPDVNDDFKPIFDLTSTNNIWTFTNYFDDGLTRPGAWKGEVRASRTQLSYIYTAANNTFIDPSTSLGLALVGSADFQVQNESGVLHWTFSHPCGITDVTYSGDKYKSGSWPYIVGLQYLQPSTVWFTAENENAPAIAYVWESFSRSVDLGNTYETIRFAIDGLLSSAIGEVALCEFDTVATSFDSDNLPAISVGTETLINFFDAKITNNTTGEYIKFKVACPVNTALIIDTESKTAYLPDGRPVSITLSDNRSDWLNLAPGVANTLQWDDIGTVAISITVAHRDKNL